MNGSATVTVKTPSTPATSINANPPIFVLEEIRGEVPP